MRWGGFFRDCDMRASRSRRLRSSKTNSKISPSRVASNQRQKLSCFCRSVSLGDSRSCRRPCADDAAQLQLGPERLNEEIADGLFHGCLLRRGRDWRGCRRWVLLDECVEVCTIFATYRHFLSGIVTSVTRHSQGASDWAGQSASRNPLFIDHISLFTISAMLAGSAGWRENECGAGSEMDSKMTGKKKATRGNCSSGFDGGGGAGGAGTSSLFRYGRRRHGARLTARRRSA